MNRQILLVLLLLINSAWAIAQAPPNDECTGAILLPVSSTAVCAAPTAGNNINATPSALIGSCAFSPTEANDVWYSFVATATVHLVRLSNIIPTNSAATFYRYSMAAFSGSCGTLTGIDCNSGNSELLDPSISMELSGLTIGNTYYLEFISDAALDVNNDPIATSYNFDMCIATVSPGSLNDECADAIDISNNQPFTTSNYDATLSIPVSNVCFIANPGNDVWFKVTATGNGDITVDQSIVDPGANRFVLQQILGDCSAPLPGPCVDNGFGAPLNTITFATTAGTTYYLRTYSNSTPNNPGGIFTINATGPGLVLPVAMDKLSGKITSPGKVQLSWNTYREQTNTGFEIQRAVDGKQFHSIGFVRTKAANGNSSELLHYEYTDNHTIVDNAYYRLAQIDRDGKTTFSNIVRLEGTTHSSFQLIALPNPVADKLIILTQGTTGSDATIQITDLSGKVQLELRVEEKQIEIDMSAYAKGIYLLKYYDNEHSQTIKINKE